MSINETLVNETPTNTKSIRTKRIHTKFLRADAGERLQVLGSEMLVKTSSAETAGAYEAVVVESRPGGDIVPHRHPWAESYYVLDGEMEVQVGQRFHQMAAGDFLTIPSMALHGFRVTGDLARFLHLSIGEGALAAFADFNALVPHAPDVADFPTILEINARHGIHVVLPEMP